MKLTGRTYKRNKETNSIPNISKSKERYYMSDNYIIDKYSISNIPSSNHGLVPSTMTVTNTVTKLPELIHLNTAKKMRFGKYSNKQYSLVAPRMRTDLSLYEKLFLRGHMNKELITGTLNKVSSEQELFITRNNSMSGIPRTTRPSMAYLLFEKRNPFVGMAQEPRSNIFYTGDLHKTNSEKERCKKINKEFRHLRSKILLEPKKAKLFAMAVIFKCNRLVNR